MNFYEIQYNDLLTNQNIYSSGSYTFMFTHINEMNFYYIKIQKQKLQKRMNSFKKKEENIEKVEENENKENEDLCKKLKEKNIEQSMDEETRKRLYEIRKQGSFMISDDNNNNFYEISF